VSPRAQAFHAAAQVEALALLGLHSSGGAAHDLLALLLARAGGARLPVLGLVRVAP
jgi:hypothetical protein